MSAGNGSRIIRPGMEKARYVTAAEARKIAESVGQLVFDELARQHNETTEQMVKSFDKELAQTREVLSRAVAELRRKSPVYVLWIAWHVDIARMKQAIEAMLERYFDFDFGNGATDEIDPETEAMEDGLEGATIDTAEKGGKIITEELNEADQALVDRLNETEAVTNDAPQVARRMTPDELEANGYPRNYHELSQEERRSGITRIIGADPEE